MPHILTASHYKASLAISAACLGLLHTASAEMAFTRLGFLGGDSPQTSSADGISPDGLQVVGGSTSASGDEAFRYNYNDGMVGLGDLDGGSFHSTALGVTNGGAAITGIGAYSGGAEAFRWTPSTGMVGLGFLDGHTQSRGFGISNDGTMIAGVSYNGSTSAEPIRWVEGVGMQSLGNLPGGDNYGWAFDISADGSVVVGYSNTDEGDEAFLWQDNEMTGLGFLPGGDSDSWAQGVSGNGQVVVGEGQSANGQEGFMWTEAGGMVGLGDLEGGGFLSGISAANFDGSILVGFGYSDIGGEATVWDAENGLQSLNDILGDLLPEGWTLISADDISDDGSVIVGIGRNELGNDEAWMITGYTPVPEPSAYALFAGAMAFALITRRRRK